MDFEELMAKLAKDENYGEEALDAIKSRIKKPNDEAKNLRKRLKEAESKNQENPVLDVLKELGLEVDEDSDVSDSVKSFVESLKVEPKIDGKDLTKTPEFVKMQKRLNKLIEKSEQDEKDKQKLIKQNQQTKIENALQEGFSKNIANGKTVLNLLINSGKNPFSVDDNGDVCYKLSDGDEITGSKEIIEEYKKQNPDQILNLSKNGVNSNISNSDKFVIPKKFTSLDQIKNMSPEQINKLTPEQHTQMMEVVAQNTKQ